MLQFVVVKNGALRNGANLRDGHAVEAVALSIATGHGAQVAGDLCRLGLVGQFDQGGAHGIGRGENRLACCRYFRNHQGLRSRGNARRRKVARGCDTHRL